MDILRLMNNYTVSSYNENTEEQLDYYIDENELSIGSEAYLYDYAENNITAMEIVNIIFRSKNPDYYDSLPEDVLLNGEDKFNCDTSAEFITDNDCYLVWFQYK